jgi:hypothetical protein
MAKSRYYPGIYLEGLKETTKNISQDSLCPAEIRTDYIPDTSIERYRCANLLGPEDYTVDRQPRPLPPSQYFHDCFKCSGASLKPSWKINLNRRQI